MTSLWFGTPFILAAGLMGTLAASNEASAFTEQLDPIAPWSYEAMLVPALDALKERYRAQDLHSRLLAWHVMENDSGLKVEAGLLWFRYRSAGFEAWALADVFRHPHRGPEWRLSYITDSEWQPLRVYSSPPRNKNVYEFGIKHWTFGEPPASFSYLRAHVCSLAWADAIGSEPERHYPNERSPAGDSQEQPK